MGFFSAPKKTVEPDCPRCRKPAGGISKIGVCDHCGEPLRVQDGKLEAVPPGFVADQTVFVVALSALRHISKWEPVWTGRCCVCGGRAVKNKALKVKSVEGHYGALLAPTNVMQTEKIDLGYCGAHADGARYANAPHFASSIDNSKCWIAFRSADFFREFMKFNALVRAAEPVPGVPRGPAEKWPCGHEKSLGATRCWDCEK